MAKKKKPKLPMEGRIMSGVTAAAPSAWLENVHPEGKIVVFDMWCKRCGICAEFCPTRALEEREDGLPYLAHPDKCTLCGLCWLRCPDMAIIKGPELPENEPTEQEAERTRRLLCDAGDDDSCELPEEVPDKAKKSKKADKPKKSGKSKKSKKTPKTKGKKDD